MRSNIELKKLYESSYENTNKLISNKNFNEEDLLNIISVLYLEQDISLLDKNNYDFDLITTLLRFYEEELRNAFNNDKERFHILFKLYLLLMELFTALCILFSANKEKRVLIDGIFELLKESKTMIKLFVPFEENELNILNNIIGEQLYYFSHVQYIRTKEKSLDYILDEYLLNCEQILHGFELSQSTNFGDNPYKEYDIEKMIVINNLSFLLLKMLHKLNYYRPNEHYFEKSNFKDILLLFKNISSFNKESIISSMDEFEEILLEEFINSSTFLQEKSNYNMWNEKLKLLSFNTDEYKQLIDIIRNSK